MIGRTIDALTGRWLAPLGATRLAGLRLLICGFGTLVIVVRTPYWLDLARLPDARWHPVGLFAGWDGAPPWWFIAVLAALALASGVAATVGWRYRWSGPCFAAALLVLTTFGNSWSQIFHTENLVVLHVGIIAFSPGADAWSIDHRRRGGDPPGALPTYGWPIRLMGGVTAMTYLVAGIAKLRVGGLDWLSGDALANHVAFDNLTKIRLGGAHSPIGGWLAARAWVFAPLAWASFLVELSAPVAVAFRRTRAWWVAAAWLFHLGVLALMALVFPYQLLGIAFAPYFAIDEWAIELRRRWSSIESTRSRLGRARAVR